MITNNIVKDFIKLLIDEQDCNNVIYLYNGYFLSFDEDDLIYDLYHYKRGFISSFTLYNHLARTIERDIKNEKS